ncbi:hypothetical protein [Bradyrhizobium erythrophlei]|uniref:CHAT domain-containing protein n=1 Tax=Bradyrhizobium erythrophlei TaxID=1437360 RepID=A0A1M5HGC0_9BRAD|nr:hypothetical protein [Bradyrhizobium erythrophlei]SHG14971.1 hypothetical protein SAMN05444169_0804 [Bradyrhizobium erythrophlei]
MGPTMQMPPQRRPATTSQRATVRAPAERDPSPSSEELARAAAQEEADRLETQKRESARLERERAEQEAAARELQRIEAERLAREHRERVQAHYSYVQDKWDLFQQLRHDAPPVLLALEKKYELEAFHKFLAAETPRILDRSAIDRFEAEINSQAKEAEAAFLAIKQSLESTSLFNNLRKLLGNAKLLELLRKCKVSVSAPELGSPGREAVASARKFLRRAWSGRLDLQAQGLFSVHRCAGKTIMHLGSSAFGSIFITLPQSLEPEAMAEAFLSEIKKASSKFIPQNGTLAVVDGDHQSINYQRIFQSNIVVRSVKDDCEGLAKNLHEMLGREPPNADNTALHFGVPASQGELNSVFKAGGADWDLWSDVAPLWANRAGRHGFDRTSSASSQQILDSLSTSKNVIIVVAHGDQRKIYLPAPPPEGSELSAEQIIARKAEISANKPVVYLFCCETAEISDLGSFSQVLLECGAAAVIAPQTKIDAERSVDFFESIVDRKTKSGDNSLTNLKEAKRSSKYSEMEIWLG